MLLNRHASLKKNSGKYAHILTWAPLIVPTLGSDLVHTELQDVPKKYSFPDSKIKKSLKIKTHLYISTYPQTTLT